MFTQLVYVQFDNGGDCLYKFKSNKKITIDKVARYFIKRDGWDENTDSITFVETPIEVTI